MKLIHMDGFIWSSTQNLAVEKTDMPPFLITDKDAEFASTSKCYL